MQSTITKTFEFAAAHRLYNESWDDETNFSVFGNCANKNGHGHNYILEVTICGEVNPETGMIINFRELHHLVREVVLHDLDHKNLNIDVPWLADKIPTAEVLVEEIWKRLAPATEASFAGVKLLRLDLWENSSSKASRCIST